ncbi:hypothetical protein [Mycoplasma sp. CSL7503-lung]|uniref:hypothetical protein n=1 Tax=Mycoplasma sp. CSL7503-lung TaxID=536372 RepID=UPI0021D2ED62|nr:hypothetical protein [Mycoplasma sp. CSL7503-lung]MCU4706664.1 hypothetical protein [Mycoplasma sp. CSL7503-lung]
MKKIDLLTFLGLAVSPMIAISCANSKTSNYNFKKNTKSSENKNNTNATIKDLEDEIKIKKETIHQLESELNPLKETNSTLSTKINTLEETISSKDKVISEQKNIIEHNSPSNIKKEYAKNIFDTTVTVLNSYKTNSDLANFDNINETLDLNISNFVQVNAYIENLINENSTELNNKEAIIAKNTKLLEGLKTKKDEFHTMLKKAKENFMKKINELTKQTDNSNSHLNDLIDWVIELIKNEPDFESNLYFQKVNDLLTQSFEKWKSLVGYNEQGDN